MNNGRTPLYNGLVYGLAAGLFGGSMWTAVALLPPDETLIAPRGLVVGGGIAFCFLAGFLVGAFNSPQAAREPDRVAREGHSFVNRILIAVGWFLYKLFVGYFVGIIATTTFALVGIAPWFGLARLFLNLDKTWLESPLGHALMSGVAAGFYCGISGGVFGALFTRRSPFHRPALGRRVVRSSFLSFLFGIPFGASVGCLPAEETRIFVCLAASVPIGILAGILGGIWTDVREVRER